MVFEDGFVAIVQSDRSFEVSRIDTNQSEDVSQTIAQEMLRRLGLEAVRRSAR